MSCETTLPDDPSKPPTDSARLALFLDLAEHYDRLRLAFPYTDDDNKIFANFADQDLPPALEVRLMLLRKFVVADENVNLHRVIAALERETPGRPASLNQDIRNLRDSLKDTKAGKIGSSIAGKDDSIHLDYYFTTVFGSLLHADWDKWNTARANRNFARTLTLRNLEDQYARTIGAVYGTIINAIDNGHLPDPRTTTGPTT